MIRIKVAEGVDTTVWISKLGLRLPTDKGWVVLPAEYWIGDADGAADLYNAFDRGLIEVSVEGQTTYPMWYLNALTQYVRVPEELLDLSDINQIASKLKQIRNANRPVIWEIARRGLLAIEVVKGNRSEILSLLREDDSPTLSR